MHHSIEGPPTLGRVTVVFLVRHGRTSANTAGVLAGWTPGVHLDDVGREQAAHVGQTLSGIRLKQIIASPLDRTVQTAEAILDAQRGRADIALDARLGECHYGTWSGKKISQLSKRPLWRTIQSNPSAVRFPGDQGESLVEMQSRAVSAIREWNDLLGRTASYAVVSHGDVIKSIVADALGMHLDMFQRIVVDPGSISVVHYSDGMPLVERINDRIGPGASVSGAPRKPVVGGGSGTDASPRNTG
jgi:probable phosphomutase (TIGR03848 family)